MRNLSKKGLSMSQAQSISNLCNQAAQEISNKISSFNVCSKTIHVQGGEYDLVEGNPMPDNVIDLLKEKGKMHATQAFLMEAIKAKEAYIDSLRAARPDLSHLEAPVREEAPDYELASGVNEEWGWAQLSDAEYAEFLEAEAYAAHLGQFIHKNGKLSEMRNELTNLPSIEWMNIEENKKSPIRIHKHHTSEYLHSQYEKIASVHRSSEQRVNYFKAKVKNLVSDENARIQKENADKTAEVQKIEKELSEKYRAELEAYTSEVARLTMEFNAQRELNIKDAAALRINVEPRFQDVIDTFLNIEM